MDNCRTCLWNDDGLCDRTGYLVEDDDICYAYERMINIKNKEGYPDPTAGKAIRAAERMPTHVYNAFNAINNVASLLGFEITGLRDKKTKKEWKK